MKVNVKRSGNVHVCYWDVGANRPLSISQYDEQPIGGFPMTFNSEHELRAKMPGYEFGFLEEVRAPQPVAIRPIDADLQVAKMISETGGGSVTKLPISPKNVQLVTGGELDKALSCYKIYLSQYQVADEEKKEKIEGALKVCAALIQTIWPGSADRLAEVKRESEFFNV